MSITVMSNVWKQSTAKGSALLLLLAISDYADENGVAWPGIETLAKKIRMTTRSVQNLTDDLVAAGELVKATRLKSGSSNMYIVLVGLTPDQLCLAQERVAHLGGDVKISTPEIKAEDLLGGDETVSSTGDEMATAYDPSSNHQSNHNMCEDAQAEPVKVLSEQQQYFGAIASALRIPTKAASNGQQGRIGKLVKRVKPLYSLQEIQAAERYWWREDWRGKKGDAPSDDSFVQTLEKLHKQKEDSRWATVV